MQQLSSTSQKRPREDPLCGEAPSDRRGIAKENSSDKYEISTHPLGLGACRPVGDFQKIARIGEGTYGTVYGAIDMKSGEKVALKRVLLHNELSDGFPITSLREISSLRTLAGHPHVVKLLDVAVNRSRDGVFLVFEYCEHDLAELLDHKMCAFTESEVKTLVIQLLDALAFLHSRSVIHRDVKMSNLLYNNKGELKLADFGLARTFSIDRIEVDSRDGVRRISYAPMTPRVVTLWYRAPELLLMPQSASPAAARAQVLPRERSAETKGRAAPLASPFRFTYGPAVDVWSAGCVAAELLRGGSPLLPGTDEIDQIQRIFELLGDPNETIWPNVVKYPLIQSGTIDIHEGRRPYSNLASSLPKGVSEAGIALFNLMLAYDPDKRIAASAAMRHEYFHSSPFPKESFLMPTYPSRHPTSRTPPPASAAQQIKGAGSSGLTSSLPVGSSAGSSSSSSSFGSGGRSVGGRGLVGLQALKAARSSTGGDFKGIFGK